MSVTAALVSSKLQDIARRIDAMIEDETGERLGFQLLVWAGGEVSYVGTDTNRANVIKALEELLTKWKADLPDTPAHERH